MNDPWRPYLEFAVDVAWRAGKITLSYFQTGIAVETKSDSSPVTVADRQTEEIIREAISARFPGHAIIGEEFGTDDRGSEFRWIIDPIDGTQAFIHGVPFYGVLIGLEYRDEPVLGVINCPAVGELVCASKGGGAYLNGRPVRVSSTSRLQDALLTTSGMEYYRPTGRAGLRRVVDRVKRFRTWGDCYGYVLVATGRSDIMVDPTMQVWDCAPLLPILQEAGGAFTDWKGNPSIRGGDAVATNGLLHAEVLSLLAE